MTERFRSNSRTNRWRASSSAIVVTSLAPPLQARMLDGSAPFLFKQICVNRKRGERIFPNESKISMNRPEHSEDARFLHPVHLVPEIFLCEHIGQAKLRFKLFRWRKKRQLNIISP